MKKMLMPALGVFFIALFITGCATPYPRGMAYTEMKIPMTATSNAKATKTGTSSCVTYLGMVAMGDASIEAAAKDGGITKISHVDYEVKNILGIIGNYKTVVRGQ